jgi:phosphate-selective porin OprO/OprP
MRKILIGCIVLVYTHAAKLEVGSTTLEVGGQIVGDTAWIKDGSHTYHDSEIRRARAYLEGDIIPSLSYEIEYSFTGKHHWKDVYLKYTGLPKWTVYLGNIKEPFGLEALTSSKYNTFMERGLADFYNSRKIGLLLKGYQKRGRDVFTYALGGFGRSLDDMLDHQKDSRSIVGRATYAKVFSKDYLFHLGLSASHTSFDANSIKLSSDAGTHLFNGSLIKTKVKHVKNTKRIGIEGAMVSGAFSFQSEYIAYSLAQRLTTYDFSGWYAQIGWFVTGESRAYKAKKAVFSRVNPKHPIDKDGLGAIEVAIRVSRIDLDDKDENGGKEQDLTLGVNWYLRSDLRLMADYTYANHIGSESKHAKILQLRVQYDF